MIGGSMAAHAQVTGTKTVGVDYTTLTAAVTDLNTNGISGSVTINVPAGYTETAPAGGYQLGSATLNGSTSATATLTIKKNGSGTDPLLTAPVGTSATVDGIFIIKGTDYVAINGIDVTESAANTTATTQMEWGYALVKLNAAAPFDGCRNVTITNCGITLNQANTASTGIYAGNHVASVNTALVIAATTDAMNSCTFSNNNITNVNTGIALNGYAAAASPYDLYDQDNTVSGNTITNFGGTTAATYGIYLAGQNNAKAIGNGLTSAAIPGTGIIRGIFHGIGTNSDFTASNNTLQLRASTGAIYGIANGTGTANSGVSGTGTITITNNIFQNYSFSAANSATHYLGVYNYAGTSTGWALGSLMMSGNIVQNMNNLNATGTIYLFYNYYCNANDVRFNNNKINSMFRSGTAGTTYCYYNYYGNPTGGADSVVGNKISNVSSPYSLYGIYDYMTATTRDRVIMNDTLTSDTASKGSTFYYLYGIYSYYGDNVTVKNCQLTNLYSVPANSGYIYGIYRYYGNNVTVSNNNFTNNTAYGQYGIYNSSAAVSSQVTNNTINNLSATTGSVYGLYSSATGTNDVYNNTIKNITGTTGTVYSLYNGGGSTVNFYNDTVYNINTNGGSIYGMYNTGGTTINAHHLHLGKLANTGTSGSAYGLYATSGTTLNFYNNLVDSLTTNATSGNGYGIYESGTSTFNCYKNKISYISANGTGGSVNGMYLNSGTVTAYNNLVGDLRTPAYTTATASSGTQLVGIYCGSAINSNLYYNTVDINASSTGTNFGSTAVYASTSTNLTMNNNVFVNTSTPLGTGMVAAYRRSSTTTTTYLTGSDNNLFYAGAPSPNTVILWDGTTGYQTLTDYKILMSPRDGAAVTENVAFQSLTGIGTAFLHPVTTTPTQIEGNGINITGITDDHYATTRAGNPGYTGSGIAPDLGAVEDAYMPMDLSAPNVSYTALPYTCATGNRTFTTTITDVTGVPTTGSLVPRVYYRKGSGAWYSQPGTLASGTATSGTWNFTIVAADMGGLAIGDVVSYFIMAQDVASTPNIGSDPAGAVATDVNTVTTYPPSPNTYNIATAMAGTYTVGMGGAYATITEAVAAYNAACISGPVTFSLIDATYPSETFPISIAGNPYASTTNTLTIRPATGISPTISGSAATALFVLDGADYVIIDGSNNPIPNSVCPAAAATRDMTIKNTSTSTSSAVVWLQSSGTTDGATNNIIRNTNIVGSGNTYTLFGIGSGGTTVAYTSSGSGNHNNRFENNSISATQTGIFSRGASATAKNNGTVINQNLLNAASPDNLRNNGIFTNFEDNITISGNSIANITNGISNDIIAINLGFNNNAIIGTSTTGNDVTNATVTNNKLDNISQTNTYSCLGIAVAGVSSGTTLIANNMISGVIAKGTGSDLSAGIFIGGAAGGVTNVYYNSVNVTGTLTGGTYPSYAIAITGSNPIVNLKNNIFANNNTAATASLQYAIGLGYNTYSNLASNNNDFYSVGTDLANVSSLAVAGTELATITDWRTTTGNDASSKNINPVFVSASDLHVAPVADNLPLMDSGAVVSVTTDIDCNSRSTTPDIGVNEFTIPPCGAITAGTITVGTAAFCGSGTTALTLPTASTGLGISYQWSASTDSVSWTPISGAVADHYTTPSLTTTTYYRVRIACSYSGVTDSASTSVTIHPLPVVVATPDGGPICSTGTGMNMTASGATAYTWSPATGLSTTTGAAVTANPAINTVYTITGTDTYGCVGTHSVAVTVSTPPASFTISPASITMCASDTAHLLTAVGPVVPSVDSVTDTSGVISVTVPDALAAGVATPLTIAGIPAGATITGVTVNFNMAMTYDGDLTINLTAPNGSTMNLVNRRGGSGHNFTNTTVSSAGGLALSAGVAPFTGTYAADAATTLVGTTSLPVTTGAWGALYSVPNGTWQLSARDFAGGDVATITSWTITVHYDYSPAITWASTTGLFNDAGATTAYTGSATTSVYARPAATTTYTATMTVGGCSNTASATVSVNPLPTAFAVTGGGGYCPGSTGVAIGLANSETGVSYQLYNGSAAVGAPVTGTGAAISFGLQTAVGTYSVIATNSGTGCTSSMTGSVNVFIHPLPATFTVTGGGSYCSGGTGVIVGLNSSETGVTYQLYNGSTATGATIAGTGSAISFGMQTAAGTYTVSATSTTTGCSSNMSGSATININPLPTAYTVTGGGSYCAGGTGVVIGLSNSTTGINYQLYNGATATGSPVAGTGGAISFGLHTAGTYTVLATNATTGCTKNMTGSVIVTAIAVPVVQTVTGGGSYCAGGTGVTVGLSNSQSGITYQLYNGSTAIGAPIAGTGALLSFGTYTAAGTYTVSASNAIGCTTDMSGSAVITIDPLPVIYILTGGGVYCEGGSGVAVGLSGSEAGISYQLYNGGVVGSPVTGTGGAISFGMQTMAGSYLVIATNTVTGCTNTMAGTAEVFINPLASPSVTISTPTGDTVCGGTFVMYTAVPVNGGYSPTYQWSLNGTPAGTGTTYGHIPANGDVITVQITSSSCASPDTASSSATMTVTSLVTPLVNISVSTGDSTCTGTLAVFTATPVYGGPAPTYRWVKNGINVATGPTYATIPANGDIVYCVMHSTYPCRFADSVTSSGIIMHVSPAVTPTVSIVAHPGLAIAPGQTDTLIAIVTGATAATYQWKKNGVIITGATASVYVTSALANGDAITCTVTAFSPCGSVSASSTVHITVTSGTGVSQVNTQGMDLRLVPNPNKGTFTVMGDLGITNDEEITLEVNNMLGQVIYKAKATAKRGQVSEQVQLDNTVANGMYILNLETANGNKAINFVIGQ